MAASASLFTSTDRLACPHAPRKLHRLTENTYIPDCGKRALWTIVGGENVKFPLRNPCTTVTSWPAGLVTSNTGEAQRRPPEFDEADMSTAMAAHPLSVLGKLSTTSGRSSTVGAAIATVRGSICSHFPHSLALYLQAARTELLLTTVTLLPTHSVSCAGRLLLG